MAVLFGIWISGLKPWAALLNPEQMNYSNEVVLLAMACGGLWEGANLVEAKLAKLLMRAASVMFGALCLGYLMLQHVALSR